MYRLANDRGLGEGPCSWFPTPCSHLAGIMRRDWIAVQNSTEAWRHPREAHIGCKTFNSKVQSFLSQRHLVDRVWLWFDPESPSFSAKHPTFQVTPQLLAPRPRHQHGCSSSGMSGPNSMNLLRTAKTTESSPPAMPQLLDTPPLGSFGCPMLHY